VSVSAFALLVKNVHYHIGGLLWALLSFNKESNNEGNQHKADNSLQGEYWNAGMQDIFSLQSQTVEYLLLQQQLTK